MIEQLRVNHSLRRVYAHARASQYALLRPYAAEFDADAVFGKERSAVIAGLPDGADADTDFVAMQTAGSAAPEFHGKGPAAEESRADCVCV